MELNRCAIYLSHADVADALQFLVRGSLLPETIGEPRQVHDQSEIGDEEFGVTKEGDWVIVFADTAHFLDGETLGLLKEWSKSRDIFMWLAQSTTAGMWFEMWRDGQLMRKWVEIEGVVEENTGTELPQETPGYFDGSSREDGRDEWSTSILAGEITGVTITRIFEMPFSVYVGRNG